MFSPDSQTDLTFRILLLGPMALIWITLVVRLCGLRSFSKMTAFDFVVTVATGSLLANAATADRWSVYLQSCAAIAVLLAMQALVAVLRRKFELFSRALENRPAILMREGRFDREAMAANRVAEDDVWAKLREANALDLSQVRAVVLETTGDISVLHGDHLAPEILTGTAD